MLISEICENFRYVEKTSAECINEDSYLVILHLSRVELHCKLQEKLHRVTWPLRNLIKVILLIYIELEMSPVTIRDFINSHHRLTIMYIV
jgi:hypothetical protein